MQAQYDLVLRRGTVVDGSGGEPFEADVALSGGRIAKIGKVDGRGAEEIDARDKLVTPGFVDIHTHYDGQVTWDERTAPSAAHGVTTAVMGNCGLGFAPCRPGDRDLLINMMVGVEDIPEPVLSAGLPWNWETFPEYLNVVDSRRRDMDVAAQLPHSALRVFVMGARGAARENATPEDLREMTRLTEEAMRAGAVGFGTSRSIFHKDGDGRAIPSKDVGEAELQAIAAGMAAANIGAIEVLLDFDQNFDAEFQLFRRIAETSGRPMSFSLFQSPNYPDVWSHALDLIDRANADGLNIKGQVIGRPTGFLLGLNLSINPFSYHPSYQAIEHLPLDARVRAMRDPQVRERILNEAHGEPPNPAITMMYAFDRLYELGNPPNYEPRPETCVAALAAKQGVSPWSIAYDMLLKEEGQGVMFTVLANYVNGDLEPVRVMLENKNTVLGLGDGGAHCGMLCDAGYPTFMLTHWARDRAGGGLPMPKVIQSLTRTPAAMIGLNDRGLLREGLKADLNVIDFDRLTLHPPRAVFDLPGGARRLMQATEGYEANIVSGQVTYRENVPTGHLPGRLARSTAGI